MTLPQHMQDALDFEDHVVTWLNSHKDVHAAIYGNRTMDQRIQEMLQRDIQGLNMLRLQPDIVTTIQRYNVFIEAKTWNKNRSYTGNHLVDEHCEIGITAHRNYTNRAHVFAFDHPDGQIGWMAYEDWSTIKGPLRATEAHRNSVCGYRLNKCMCQYGAEGLVAALKTELEWLEHRDYEDETAA